MPRENIKRKKKSLQEELLTRPPGRQKWNKLDMEKAVEDVYNKKMGVLKASKLYNVPKTTLLKYVHQTADFPTATFFPEKLGRKTLLPSEVEEELVEIIHLMEKNNCTLKPVEIKSLAYKLAIKHSILDVFHNERAGKTWFYSFIRRHNIVLQRNKISNNVDVKNKKAEILKEWFECDQIVQENIKEQEDLEEDQELQEKNKEKELNEDLDMQEQVKDLEENQEEIKEQDNLEKDQEVQKETSEQENLEENLKMQEEINEVKDLEECEKVQENIEEQDLEKNQEVHKETRDPKNLEGGLEVQKETREQENSEIDLEWQIKTEEEDLEEDQEMQKKTKKCKENYNKPVKFEEILLKEEWLDFDYKTQKKSSQKKPPTRPPERNQWSTDDMAKAIEIVRKKKMGYKKASILYNVPKSSLRRFAQKMAESPTITVVQSKLGRKTVFSPDLEKKLVKMIEAKKKKNHALTRADVLSLAIKLATKHSIPNSFHTKSGGKGWLDSFLSRHNIVLFNNMKYYSEYIKNKNIKSQEKMFEGNQEISTSTRETVDQKDLKNNWTIINCTPDILVYD